MSIPTEQIYDFDNSESDWKDQGDCKGYTENGHYPFFGPDSEQPAERQSREIKAKAICGACAVRLACLGEALSRRETYGIWGGKTEAELRAIRRSPKRIAQALGEG